MMGRGRGQQQQMQQLTLSLSIMLAAWSMMMMRSYADVTHKTTIIMIRAGSNGRGHETKVKRGTAAGCYCSEYFHTRNNLPFCGYRQHSTQSRERLMYYSYNRHCERRLFPRSLELIFTFSISHGIRKYYRVGAITFHTTQVVNVCHTWISLFSS